MKNFGVVGFLCAIKFSDNFSVFYCVIVTGAVVSMHFESGRSNCLLLIC